MMRSSSSSALMALICFALATMNCHANQYKTGNTLLEACNDEYLQMFCMGYVVGVADLVQGLQSAKVFDPPGICIDQPVTQGQLKAVAVKYLEENPQDLHYTANSLVFSALRKAFPCPE